MIESCGRCVLRLVLCCAYWYSHIKYSLSEVWVSPRRSLPTVLYGNDLTRSWNLSPSNVTSLTSPAFFNCFNFYSQKVDSSIWWNKNVEYGAIFLLIGGTFHVIILHTVYATRFFLRMCICTKVSKCKIQDCEYGMSCYKTKEEKGEEKGEEEE